MYYGGESNVSTDCYRSVAFSCPFCTRYGLTESALREHVLREHVNARAEAVCPICVTTNDSEHNRVMGDLPNHLAVDHSQYMCCFYNYLARGVEYRLILPHLLNISFSQRRDFGSHGGDVAVRIQRRGAPHQQMTQQRGSTGGAGVTTIRGGGGGVGVGRRAAGGAGSSSVLASSLGAGSTTVFTPQDGIDPIAGAD